MCLSISLIPRCSNSSAHEFASLGLVWDSEQSCIWIGPLLDPINVQVIRDLVESGDGNERP